MVKKIMPLLWAMVPAINGKDMIQFSWVIAMFCTFTHVTQMGTFIEFHLMMQLKFYLKKKKPANRY